MNGRVLSLNIGQPRLVTYRGMTFRTGIFKEPVDAPLVLKKLNFAGDGQADLSAHGGIDKAVYCYPIEHYPFWEQEIGRDGLPMGQFGENITTEGLLENQLRIGDFLRFGTAVLQVSEPRVPCYKLVMRMDAGTDFAVRFLAANRTGFYCRVIEEGIVKPQDTVSLLSTDPSSPRVSEVFAATQFTDRDPVELRRVLKARDISVKWRTRIRRMIDAETHRQMVPAWSEPVPFLIDEIVPAARDVRSIWLRPVDGRALPDILPGQYLTLVWADGLTRTYSLSATDGDERYRITVKLERRTDGALGRASARIAAFTADEVIGVLPPRGSFHPDIDDDTPLVLACAGIGATPIMSMIDRATRNGRRKVFAAFGMRRPDEHPLAAELASLAEERQGLEVLVAYSGHDDTSPPGLPPAKPGRLAAADLLPHATERLAEIFLCGPGGFIRQMHDDLVAAGIDSQRIRYESFGPSTLTPARDNIDVDPAARFSVSFVRSQVDAEWTPAKGTILNLAEAAGISPVFGCRSGSCGLCRIGISEGRVSYVEPVDEPESGYVLPCCAIPETDCRLEM